MNGNGAVDVLFGILVNTDNVHVKNDPIVSFVH